MAYQWLAEMADGSRVYQYDPALAGLSDKEREAARTCSETLDRCKLSRFLILDDLYEPVFELLLTPGCEFFYRRRTGGRQGERDSAIEDVCHIFGWRRGRTAATFALFEIIGRFVATDGFRPDDWLYEPQTPVPETRRQLAQYEHHD